MPTKNTIFSSGNVEIVFPWKTYVVHSDILRASSGYFDGVFNWPEVGSGGDSTCSSFVLGKDNFLQRGGPPDTCVAPGENLIDQSTENANPTTLEEYGKDDSIIERNFTEMVQTFYGDKAFQALCDTKNITPSLLLIQRAWDNMLRAFYHRSVQIPNIIVVCELIALADQYCALEAVVPAVEAMLYQQGQKILSEAIGLYPCIFLTVAYKIRSKTLFKEAFIHCVGQYASLKDHLHPPFLGPINTEYQRLKDLRANANEKIMSFGLGKSPAALSAAITAVCEAFRWVDRHHDRDTSFDGYSAGKLYRILSHDNFWDIDFVQGNIDFRCSLDEGECLDPSGKVNPRFRCFGAKPSFGAFQVVTDFQHFMKTIQHTTRGLAQNNLTLAPHLNHGIDYLLCAEFNQEDFPGLESETDWPY